ncbi:hypothetical protein MBAV_005906 [Candidatus Magnetobacterium bavaricum]|uniref:Uncharacterized protein n=1 Tax=Candidatus Magnetobacterium bavaricum TaxID=29290 RepID=A0A0F3GIX0_9BACT|nr:hypothetical protein MBAV_005906 [Candidatus Magnetobacterium bavaricum]
MMEAMIPNALASSGNIITPMIHCVVTPGTRSAITPARIIAPMFSAAVDSNRSAPRPAQSPTLSPTRSAITAGFLGSSSGMPASTLPTRSAPTSAALVYIPPPSCAKSATNEAPKPYPTIKNGIFTGSISVKARTSQYSPPTPKRLIETTISPDTAPPRNAT